MTLLHISSAFDSGAIEVVTLANPDNIELRIRADNAAEFVQWFHFCLHGAAGEAVTLRFLNAEPGRESVRVLRVAAAEYEKLTGIKVVIDTVPPDDAFSKTQAAIAAGTIDLAEHAEQ